MLSSTDTAAEGGDAAGSKPNTKESLKCGGHSPSPQFSCSGGTSEEPRDTISGQFELEPLQKQQSDDWQRHRSLLPPPTHSPVPHGVVSLGRALRVGPPWLKLLPREWQSEVPAG